MRFTAIYRYFFIVCLIAPGFLVTANNCKIDLRTEPSDSTKPYQILYLELLQPILFEKAGLAYTIGRSDMELMLYGNYIFGPKSLIEAPFENNSENKWIHRKGDYDGFEIGLQGRYKIDNWQKVPYADYIKKESGTNSSFYTGIWLEYAKASGDPSYYIYESVSLQDIKFGGLVAWSFEYAKFLLDVSLGVGGGKAWATLTSSMNEPDLEESNALVVYKLGIKLGLKL